MAELSVREITENFHTLYDVTEASETSACKPSVPVDEGEPFVHLAEQERFNALVFFAIYWFGNVNKDLLLNYTCYYGASTGSNVAGSGASSMVTRMDRIGTFGLQPLETSRVLAQNLARRIHIRWNEIKGKPQEAFFWRNCISETLLLTRPSLASHPNIVSSLSVEFSKLPYPHILGQPYFVFEYSQHGSLTAFLERASIIQSSISAEMKLKLSLDVGRGLLALHESGIVHFDLKCDNILIFDDPQHTFIAKITDFGSATSADLRRKAIHVTPSWAAPELAELNPYTVVKLDDAKLMDLYSYGLLIWSVQLDGVSLSQDDRIAKFISRHQPTELPGFEGLKASKEDALLAAAKETLPSDNMHKVYSAISYLCCNNPKVRALPQALSYLDKDYRVTAFEPILSNGITKETGFMIARLMRDDKVEQWSVQDVDSNVVLQLWFQLCDTLAYLGKSEAQFWNKEAFVVSELDFIATFQPRCRSEAILVRLACMSLYKILLSLRNASEPGVHKDVCRYIWIGAKTEDEHNLEPRLKPIAFRFHQALSVPIPDAILARKWVHDSVEAHGRGLNFLLENLQEDPFTNADFNEFEVDRSQFSAHGKFGHPADTRFEPHGHWGILFCSKYADLVLPFESLEDDYEYFVPRLNRLLDEGINLQEIKLTLMGDSLLHYAATRYRQGLLELLTGKYHFSLDALNHAGQTSLYQASRVGNNFAVQHLIQKGASPKIGNSTGAIPLHFITRFLDCEIDTILPLLVDGDSEIIQTFMRVGVDPMDLYFTTGGSSVRYLILTRRTTLLRCFLSICRKISHRLYIGFWEDAMRDACSIHFVAGIQLLHEMTPQGINILPAAHMFFLAATNACPTERIAFHGLRYTQVAEAALDLLFSIYPDALNSAPSDCLLYLRAQGKGNSDMLSYLIQKGNTMKNTSVTASQRLLPDSTAGLLSLQRSDLDGFFTLCTALDVDFAALDGHESSRIAMGVLIGGRFNVEKVSIFQTLLERGWRPTFNAVRWICYHCPEGVETILKAESFTTEDLWQLVHHLVDYTGVETIPLENFLNAVEKTLEIAPSFFKSKPPAPYSDGGTIYHALVHMRLNDPPSRIRTTVQILSCFFKDPQYVISEDGAGLTAFETAILLLQVDFLDQFTAVFADTLLQTTQISSCWLLLEQCEIFNFFLSRQKMDLASFAPTFGMTDKDPSVFADKLGVMMRRSQKDNYKMFKSLNRHLKAYNTPFFKQKELIQEFISALAELDIPEIRKFATFALYPWEVARIEPSLTLRKLCEVSSLLTNMTESDLNMHSMFMDGAMPSWSDIKSTVESYAGTVKTKVLSLLSSMTLHSILANSSDLSLVSLEFHSCDIARVKLRSLCLLFSHEVFDLLDEDDVANLTLSIGLMRRLQPPKNFSLERTFQPLNYLGLEKNATLLKTALESRPESIVEGVTPLDILNLMKISIQKLGEEHPAGVVIATATYDFSTSLSKGGKHITSIFKLLVELRALEVLEGRYSTLEEDGNGQRFREERFFIANERLSILCELSEEDIGVFYRDTVLYETDELLIQNFSAGAIHLPPAYDLQFLWFKMYKLTKNWEKAVELGEFVLERSTALYSEFPFCHDGWLTIKNIPPFIPAEDSFAQSKEERAVEIENNLYAVQRSACRAWLDAFGKIPETFFDTYESTLLKVPHFWLDRTWKILSVEIGDWQHRNFYRSQFWNILEAERITEKNSWEKKHKVAVSNESPSYGTKYNLSCCCIGGNASGQNIFRLLEEVQSLRVQ